MTPHFPPLLKKIVIFLATFENSIYLCSRIINLIVVYMDYIFRKDVNSNWHIDGVEPGSKREHRLCWRLSRRYFGGELIADTPNMLVECVVRIRTPKWSNLPSLMESCSELVFYDFDGCVYFFFNDKKMHK